MYGLAAAAALVGGVVAAASDHRRLLSCEANRSSVGKSTVVECESQPVSDTSVIGLTIPKDRAQLLADTTGLLKKHGLEIKESKIAKKDEGHVRHTFLVHEKASGKSLSSAKCSTVRKALEGLGASDCSVKTWPMYTRAEVSKHNTTDSVWVSYKNGVYDITEFIQNHPGGTDKLMLAAGKAIDPFWRIYQMHESRGTAVNMLEALRIGDLADPAPVVDSSDPYASDPSDRHPGLIMHNNKPCNAECPAELMMDDWLTPNPVWFIRHHHPVPIVDPKKYRLLVEGGPKPISLSLGDLKKRFKKHEVISTIQCGGNRRSELDKLEKTSGISWGPGAMSTAKWGGVYLREVLMHCTGLSLEGVDENEFKHVVSQGMDEMQASIPIEKALSPFGDVLLAYEMNGEPLPPEHGFPVRLVTPGIVGVRNVKWVSKVTVSKEEATGPWQRGMAYKGFSPMQKDIKDVDVEKILSMQEMPVTSAIMTPKDGAKIELDDIEVKGWAWSGGGRGIVRVDVSVDDGKTWMTADLLDGADQNPSRAWAWTFFECAIPVPDHLRGKEVTVLCRATDASYAVQPEQPGPIWNLRGLNCNCWHRVTVQHIDD